MVRNASVVSRGGHDNPVSRTVMLSRPGREVEPRWRRVGVHLRDAVVDQAVGPAEHEQVAAAHVDVGERGGPAIDAGEPEHARVAEADRHDRRVGRLVAVLVDAEAGARRVEVDDRRVGRERQSPPGSARP